MKNGIKTAVIVVVCAALCLGYYYYLSHRDSGKEKERPPVTGKIVGNMWGKVLKSSGEFVIIKSISRA